MGELSRRLIAKQLLHDDCLSLQQLCLRARQFGILVPDVAEALMHARFTMLEVLE